MQSSHASIYDSRTMHAIDHALDHLHWMDEKNVMTVVSMPLLMSQGYAVVKMSLSGNMIQ